MFKNTESLYYSKTPLSEETEWVAFPVFITSKGKDYQSALSNAKALVSGLLTALKSIENQKCKITQALNNDEEKDINTVIEFQKINNDCVTHVYNYMVLTFQETVQFWEKMEYVTQGLDTIMMFSEQHKGDKHIDI